MKKKWMKGTGFLSLLAVSVMLAGCGKDSGTETDKANQAEMKNCVYSEQSFDLGIDEKNGSYLNGLDVEDDRILATIYQYEGDVPAPRAAVETEAVAEETADTEETAEAEVTADTEETAETGETEAEEGMQPVDMPDMGEMPDSKVTFRQYDYDANVLAEFTQDIPGNAGMNFGVLGKNGTVYTIYNEYASEGDGEGKDVNYLKAFDEKGGELWSLELGKDTAEDDWYYINGLQYSSDGKIYLLTSKGVEVVKEDGTYEKAISIGNVEGYQFFPKKNGNLYIYSYSDEGPSLYEMDMAAGKLNTEPVTFPFDISMYSISAGVDSDFILADVNGIFSYNVGDEKMTKMMDFIASDVMALTASDIKILSDGRILGSYYDQETGSLCAGIYTKVAPEDVKEKKNLTLAGTYIAYDVRKCIIDFNKKSDEYKINVKDYSIYNSGDDYMASVKKLNTDIASGAVPDILIADQSLPIDSYINKGLFADLYTFMDQDSEIKKEDYMQNVFDACSKDGKLYQLMPSFYIGTILGKKEDVGNTPGWNFDDLNAVLAKKGPDTVAFSEVTSRDIINYSMMFGGASYIDWATGECRFTSDDFLEVLEFAKQFPQEIDYEALQNDESYWEKYETMYRDGRTLLMPSSISNFRDYNINEKGPFGADIIPVGFPNEAKESGVITGNISFAISAKSDYADAAWQFLRHYLSDEYQKSIEYAWPVKKSVIDDMAKAAQKRPVMKNEDGTEEEYDDTYYLNGQEIVIPPMTKEETDELIDYISGVTRTYTYNEDVMQILEEECAPFFEGKKSAKEVADIIQSRVQIYVNENR